MQQGTNLQPPTPPQPLTLFDKALLAFNVFILIIGIPYFLETYSLLAAVFLTITVLGTIRIIMKMIRYNTATQSQPYPYTPPPPYPGAPPLPLHGSTPVHTWPQQAWPQQAWPQQQQYPYSPNPPHPPSPQQPSYSPPHASTGYPSVANPAPLQQQPPFAQQPPSPSVMDQPPAD